MTRRTYRAPSCGHSACSQHWIDTGGNPCVLRQERIAAFVRGAVLAVWGVLILALLVIEACRPEWIMQWSRLHG
jgi:hypothetical protein